MAPRHRPILSGEDERVAAWLATRIDGFEYGDTPYSAIGLLDSGGHLIAGSMYTHYVHQDVRVTFALAGVRSCTRYFLGECFRYPFLGLGCHRITTLVRQGNSASHNWCLRLGFALEGTVREYFPSGEDCLIFGMLRAECRWLDLGVKRHDESDARMAPDGRSGRFAPAVGNAYGQTRTRYAECMAPLGRS
jgi:hypothetical protein